MSKIIESKIKKLQELQTIENRFDEAIKYACENLLAVQVELQTNTKNFDKSVSAIVKEYAKRINNAIKELNGTRFERKKNAENDDAQPAKKGGKA